MTTIREARISAGLSKVDLADRMGVLRQWESGKARPSPAKRKQREGVLDLSAGAIASPAGDVARTRNDHRSDRDWSRFTLQPPTSTTAADSTIVPSDTNVLQISQQRSFADSNNDVPPLTPAVSGMRERLA